MRELKIGRSAPNKVNAIIEVPKYSNVKYEVHKETGFLKVSRFLFTATSYPYNYGFIPETLENDNDPLDIMVISDEAVVPGCVIEVKPIGMLVTQDEAGTDNKVIALPVPRIDPTYSTIKDIKGLDRHVLERIAHFFETYKELEPDKWVKVLGFKNKATAHKRILKCMKEYQKECKKNKKPKSNK